MLINEPLLLGIIWCCWCAAGAQQIIILRKMKVCGTKISVCIKLMIFLSSYHLRIQVWINTLMKTGTGSVFTLASLSTLLSECSVVLPVTLWNEHTPNTNTVNMQLLQMPLLHDKVWLPCNSFGYSPHQLISPVSHSLKQEGNWRKSLICQ